MALADFGCWLAGQNSVEKNRPSVGVTPCIREGHANNEQSLLSSFHAFTQREQGQ